MGGGNNQRNQLDKRSTHISGHSSAVQTRSSDRREVHLADIWPDREEIDQFVSETVHADLFEVGYTGVFTGGSEWDRLEVPDHFLMSAS